MFSYAICEINGKQYKVLPNKPFNVDLQTEAKQIKVKTLLKSDGGKISVGKPYLDDLTLNILESVVLGKKIRVAKFHAKANYRKVTGLRPKYTKVVYGT